MAFNRPKRSRVTMLILAIVVLVALIAGLLSSIRVTSPVPAYPLDDTYIGMAMARNLAFHGVWGVTRYAFSSSASSPLFILLLAACYRITGVNEWWPLALSITFAVLAVFAGWRASRDASRRVQLGSLAGIIGLTPLFAIAVLGMEHSLQIFLCILFADGLSRVISGERRVDLSLLAVTVCLVASRYEGLFLAAPACLLLLWRRRVFDAVVLGAAACLPVIIYGLVSVSQGSHFLPNSLLLKGTAINYRSWRFPLSIAHRIALQFRDAPFLAVMFIALIVAAATALRVGEWRRFALTFLALGALAIHMAFARVGWVYRYEAYLIALGVLALAMLADLAIARRNLLLLGLIAATGFLLVQRSVIVTGRIPLHAWAIGSQQYQMALFLSRYFPTVSIAANDIGAMTFMNDLHCIDLVGLANENILRAKRNGNYTTEYIDDLTRRSGTQIAIVYDDWFREPPGNEFGGPQLPSGWRRVARWQIPDFAVVGGNTVSFYAVTPALESQLKSSLAQFVPSLPRNVTVSFD